MKKVAPVVYNWCVLLPSNWYFSVTTGCIYKPYELSLFSLYLCKNTWILIINRSCTVLVDDYRSFILVFDHWSMIDDEWITIDDYSSNFLCFYIRRTEADFTNPMGWVCSHFACWLLRVLVSIDHVYLWSIMYNSYRSSSIIPIFALCHPYVAPSLFCTILLCTILVLPHPCVVPSLLYTNHAL